MKPTHNIKIRLTRHHRWTVRLNLREHQHVGTLPLKENPLRNYCEPAPNTRSKQRASVSNEHTFVFEQSVIVRARALSGENRACARGWFSPALVCFARLQFRYTRNHNTNTPGQEPMVMGSWLGINRRIIICTIYLINKGPSWKNISTRSRTNYPILVKPDEKSRTLILSWFPKGGYRNWAHFETF